VRQTPRDFAPGGAALRGDEAGDVVEHDHVSRRRPFRQLRAAQEQHLRGGRPAVELDLRLPLLAPCSAKASRIACPNTCSRGQASTDSLDSR
jgi:hypothetical protein